MTSFPRLLLVLPPVFPIALHALGSGMGWRTVSGHSPEPWVMALWLLYGLVALIGIVVVPFAAYKFATIDAFRTAQNLLYMLIGACVPVFVVGLILRNVLFGT